MRITEGSFQRTAGRNLENVGDLTTSPALGVAAWARRQDFAMPERFRGCPRSACDRFTSAAVTSVTTAPVAAIQPSQNNRSSGMNMTKSSAGMAMW